MVAPGVPGARNGPKMNKVPDFCRKITNLMASFIQVIHVVAFGVECCYRSSNVNSNLQGVTPCSITPGGTRAKNRL